MDLWRTVIFTSYLCYVQADACTTPSGKPGQCQSILECGLLKDLALKPDITKEEIYMLRKSACGFSSILPKVCCPDVWDDHDCMLSAGPPDSRARCCGVPKEIKEGTSSSFPWMGIIEFQKETVGNLRNAVLISGRFAVSVAQCFTPKFVAKYGRPTIIRFGLDTFSIPVERVFSHADYSENGHFNDIALLKLIYTAPYTDLIRPICLPSSDFAADGEKETTLARAGWGIVDGRSRNNPSLRSSQSHYLEAEVCAATLTNITSKKTELKSTQLCIIIGKDGNSLDLGGPLMYANPRRQVTELAGIASYPLKQGFPDVFTKVYEYRSWILEQIQN